MRPGHRHGRDCKVTSGVADAMFHVAAVPAVHACPFRRGNVALIMSRFELEAFLTPIEKHQIDVLGNVPPLVIAIIISPLMRWSGIAQENQFSSMVQSPLWT